MCLCLLLIHVYYVCVCTSKLDSLCVSCVLKRSLVRKYNVFREELCCPGEKERESKREWKESEKCVRVCVCVWIVFVSFSLMAVNQHGFGRVKVQIVLSCLFTISATLTFSCNHRNPVHLSLSLSPCVSLCLSNWCAASTHQLSGEGPIAELQASQLLSRQVCATRTQSDIQNLPEGSAMAAWWRGGQSGSNAGAAPPPLFTAPSS